MRSTIWKLSALATVIGLGLVAVVIQQKGLGKPAAAGTAANTPAAPQPNTPQQAKSQPGKSQSGNGQAAAAADPFAGNSNEQPAALSELPPEEVALTNEQEFANTATTAASNEDDTYVSPRTRSRTKVRGQPAPLESDVVDEQLGQVADSRAAGNASRRGRAGAEELPPEPGRVLRGDPAAMEGTLPSDQESAALTSDDDPFAKRREALAAGNAGSNTGARGTRGSPPANRNSSNFENDSSPYVPNGGGGGGSNPFDQGGEVSGPPLPAMPAPKARGRSRARLIEDGEPPSVDRGPAGPVNPGQIDIVEQPADDSFGGRAGARTPGMDPRSRQVPPDSNDYIENETVPVSGVETVPPSLPGQRGKNRPRMMEDDEPRTMRDAAGNSLQSIPKKSEEGPLVSDQDLTPPVAQGQRSRPNSLRDDDEDPPLPRTGNPPGSEPPPENPGEGGPPERELDPQIIDSAIPVPNERRPAPRAFDNGPNVPGELPGDGDGMPEAAVSRDSETHVIAVPKRRASVAGMPGGGPGGTNRVRGKVTIEKRAPATAYIGQPLVYQIVVRNIGNGEAQQVKVEDIIPDGVAMQGSIPQAEMVGNKLTWRLGSLASGEERKVSVKVVPNTEGAVGSAATVNFVADTSGFGGDVPAESYNSPPPAGGTSPRGIRQASTQPVDNEARSGSGLSIEILGPKQVNAGQSFDLRFRVTNRSNQAARNLIIHKVLPEGLQHPRGQDLEYSLGTLNPGQVREIPMNITAVQPGRAVSRIDVMTSTYQVIETKEFSIDVGGVGSPAMGAVFPVTLERMGNSRPTVNRATAYANRVTNRGAQPVSRLQVTESIPKGLEFVSVGDAGQYDEQNRKVVWTIERLEPNASTDLEISLVAKDRIPHTTLVVAADRDGHQVQASLQVTGG